MTLASVNVDQKGGSAAKGGRPLHQTHRPGRFSVVITLQELDESLFRRI